MLNGSTDSNIMNNDNSNKMAELNEDMGNINIDNNSHLDEQLGKISLKFKIFIIDIEFVQRVISHDHKFFEK